MGRLEIAIAGCGPAGLAAALLLNRDGHSVSVFERFETSQPVGSGIMLQPTGLAVLKALDLDQSAIAAGARVERLFGRAVTSGNVVLDVRYRALGNRSGFGLGMHRATLFDILHHAVEASGISIETGREIAESTTGNGRRLSFCDGRSAGPFDLIVDALGSSTTLAAPTGRALNYGALWANLDWPTQSELRTDALEQRYRRANVMAGVLPIGRNAASPRAQAAFFWSLRKDRLDAWGAQGLEAWKQDVREVWPSTEPLLAQIDHQDKLTFARYVHKTVSAVAQPGLVRIGDAWHSASPQLGQGANMALLDAYALAKALRDTTDPSAALARYVELRRRHVILYQRMSALFTPVYQSDSRILPFVRDRLVGPISKLWPATVIQAAMVSGLIGSPLKRLGLTS